MRRKRLLVGILAISSLAVGLAATTALGANNASVFSLAEQIDVQTGETAAAVKAAENVWAPRVGGLGIGLAVGLLGGGLLSYVNRGGDR